MFARRLAVVVAVSLCSLVAGVLLAASAFALPPERHYEMVSPLFKGGYGIHYLYGAAVEGPAEGDRVAFASLGSFAGAANNGLYTMYMARRGSTSWSTEAIEPPASLLPKPNIRSDLSPSLGALVTSGWPGPNSGVSELESTEAKLMLYGLDAPGERVPLAEIPLKRADGKRLYVLTIEATSRDLCHVVVAVGLGSSESPLEALLPEAYGTRSYFYDVATGAPGCGGKPALKLVAASNEMGPHGEPKPLDPTCLVFLGPGESSNGLETNAISSDGSEIFFTAHPSVTKPECDGEAGTVAPNDPATLYVRLGGERTLQVSKPIAADCASGPCTKAQPMRAEFAGASPDGARVFFTTRQPLVSGDTDTGKDLYMAQIGCPPAKSGCSPSEREVTSLVQISHDLNPEEAAEVQDVAVLSLDASHVYFVARGVLSGEGPSGSGAQPAPVAGADNLYVYDVDTGVTRFIGDLCSGPEESGQTADPRCPAQLEHLVRNDEQLWLGSGQLQATQDGNFLLFATYARLLSNDTDAARDIYRYDAVTGALDRVSVGEGGFDANGNDSSFNAQIPQLAQTGNETLYTQYEMNVRAISEDGSRAVFETAEPLSPQAVNGLTNAYEWHKEPGWSEGRVSLVSSGSDPTAVGVEGEGNTQGTITITPSGRDIFFLTDQSLLAQDTDEAADLYDARLGEGFPVAGAPTQPCSGDACQGPLTNPAPLLVPGSASQTPGENVTVAAKAAPPRTAAQRKRLRKWHRGRRVSHAHGRGRRAHGKGGRR